MRRAALLLAAAVVAMAMPATAPAAEPVGVDGVAAEFELPANNGLGAELWTAPTEESERRLDSVTFEVHNETELAVFRVVQDAVTPDGIEVDFGRYGHFEAEFRPFKTLDVSRPPPQCRGEPWTEKLGWFVGDFQFRGERDFVRIDARRVKGVLSVSTEWDCPRPSGPIRLQVEAEKPRAATVTAGARALGRSFRVFGSHGENPRKDFAVYVAGVSETREGIEIGRGVGVPDPGTGFSFDTAAGTASVSPPAPFRGSARFSRLPGGGGRWTGDLSAPLLGLGRVSFAGPEWRARMKPHLPRFD